MKKTLRERLAARLLEVGWVVNPDEFHPARGGRRTSRIGNYHRWEAIGSRSGEQVLRVLVSYDTMTVCARYGVTVTRRHPHWVGANTPPVTQPRDLTWE